MTLPSQFQSQQQNINSPKSSSFPCLIRQVLFAPRSPNDSITHLIEVALTHHNTSNYQLAIQTYLRAQREWYELYRNRALKEEKENSQHSNMESEDSFQEAAPIQDASKVNIPVSAYLFFRLAIGGVYESAGNDELALQQYMDAKRHAEHFLEKEHADRAMTYSAIGQIFFHMRHLEQALTYFNRSRELRVILLGSEHVDTAVSNNNVAVCLHALERYQQSTNLYNKALIVFKQQLGVNHPRTGVVQRNITKLRNSFLNDFALEDTKFGEVYLPIEKKKAKKKGKKGKKKKKKK